MMSMDVNGTSLFLASQGNKLAPFAPNHPWFAQCLTTAIAGSIPENH